jgi:ComF family protein
VQSFRRERSEGAVISFKTRRSGAMTLARAGSGLLDLILPPRALDEGAGAVQSLGLSAQAWGRITFIEAPCCDACGAPFAYDQGEGALCPACHARRPAFDRGRAACLYDEASRDLILKLKHADRSDLAGLFARWIARSAGDLIAGADALIPVPLHRLRLLSRRYNQAAEIARRLSARSGVAYFPDALKRVRATRSQGGQSASGRRRNVAGAFCVPPGWRRRIEGRRLVLIDDVLTTGATLEGCARALRTAGAAGVDIAVIARVKESASRPI